MDHIDKVGKKRGGRVCDGAGGAVGVRPFLMQRWNDEVFGQQKHGHPLICVAFSGGSARSESQRRSFMRWGSILV